MFTIKVYLREEYKSKIFIQERGDKFPYRFFYSMTANIESDT